MVENMTYEFEGFRLDPTRRTLSNDGQLRSLRPTAFDLLVALVENHGRTVTKSDIIKRVWGADSADDRNFHVTLYAVRQSLGESAQAPHFIVRDANGYRFAVEVRLRGSTTRAESDIEASTSEASNGKRFRANGNIQSGELSVRETAKHFAFLLGACALYAALYSVALLLEVAYACRRGSSITPRSRHLRHHSLSAQCFVAWTRCVSVARWRLFRQCSTFHYAYRPGIKVHLYEEYSSSALRMRSAVCPSQNGGTSYGGLLVALLRVSPLT